MHRGFATPEEMHLHEQEARLAELADRLALKETEYLSEHSAFARFRLEYLRRFAPLYAELDRLEAERARSTMEDASADGVVEAAERRATESQEFADSYDAGAFSETPLRSQSDQLRELYRTAARMVHPDLTSDEDERQRRTRVMARITQAYRDHDESTIREILEEEGSRPEAVTGDDVGSRLVRVLREISQIQRRFQQLVQLSEALEMEPLYPLYLDVKDSWLAGDDPLQEDEADLRTRIDELRGATSPT